MDDQVASDMLAELMESLMKQDAGDVGVTLIAPEDQVSVPVIHAPSDVDGYVLHGRRPFAPPRHVWVTWQDQNLFLREGSGKVARSH